ncbi:MAG: hypothetical protein KH828_07495 [Clostridiales bacterium]|nr:hypothetical protein [Clostridiales bacterium]
MFHIEQKMDFVIVFPSMVSVLLSDAGILRGETHVVQPGRLMPEAMTEYLLQMINTNRYASQLFRYRQIREEPLERMGLYRLLGEQLGRMGMDGIPCFTGFRLTGENQREAGFQISYGKEFLRASRDEGGRFLYLFSDTRREEIILKKDKIFTDTVGE